MALLLAPTATVVFPTSRGIDAVVQRALDEDIGRGDLTTEATVPSGTQATAEIVQKATGVLCGLPIVDTVFAQLDLNVRVSHEAAEGSYSQGRRTVARIEGAAAAILSGERTALNFIQRLSGIATVSRKATDLIQHTHAQVIDTRKTTPGLRVLEKYAVRVGGARNHRAGLDDGFLIKENHIRAAGGITRAVHAAQGRAAPGQIVEVEVTNLTELGEALQAGARLVLLDNFTTAGLREAVQRAAGRARLEASGGITLSNLVEVAETGVDFISLGALTHSAGVLDFSLDLEVRP
ncbi:MAG TPA: carboxylating nicotinate-nucleotide diphosphorylase [Chloroflexota bacterium]|jgi:nicotinate-nucleotide pyrophosphorylase (carboxylating)|nr:carboxylating nicotinate-nucleotide diphosphorylase [Chloroflexota bacterium]